MASLYVPTSVIKLTADMYEGTASPHNNDYLGTSSFINLLKKLNYSVEIAETQQDFMSRLKKGSLAVVIAPDRKAPPPLINALLQAYKTGKANVLIADENITSNNVLKALANVEVDGRAVFSYEPEIKGKRTPFPEAVMTPYLSEGNYQTVMYSISQQSLNKTRVYLTLKLMVPSINTSHITLRLNWASFIKPSHNALTPYWVKGYFLLGVTIGYIDLNNDGKLQNSEIINQPETVTAKAAIETGNYSRTPAPFLIEGLAIPSKDGSLLLVFSDSFFFTNQALAHKSSPYTMYLTKLLSNPLLHREAVICDCLYQIAPKTLKIPYHPAVLMYLATSMLHLIDSKATQAIQESPLISLSVAIVLVLITTLLISKAVGGRSYVHVTPSGVEEVSVIAETEVKKSLLKGGPVRNPKETVESTWEILNYVFKRVLGHTADEILKNDEVLAHTAQTLGVGIGSFKEDLKWLQKIYYKAVGRSLFPLIISWRRALRKYIILSDKVLSYVGYTLLRKGGLKRIESILH